MPYKNISELPTQFQSLPTGAKKVAMNVINSALSGGSSEVSAIKQAWGAIKRSYKKSGDVWVANNASFTDTIGCPYNDEADNTKFSYIAQTEGVHQDVSGKKILYTADNLIKSAPSHIGNKLSIDPMHKMRREGREDERPDVATVVDSEVRRINTEMAKQFKLDPSLIGRYAQINVAKGDESSSYNAQIAKGQFTHVSTELRFTGEQDDNGVYYPTNIEYQGGILLNDEGADPGAKLLEIYNTKYGGNSMSEEDVTPPADGAKPPEGEEGAKPPEDGAAPPAEGGDGKPPEAPPEVEEAKKEAEAAKEEAEEAKAENAKLQKQIEELEAANAQSKTTEEKVEVLEKALEASNAKVKALEDVKKREVLTELVDNEKYVESILEQDLDDAAFNAKVEEIKALKDVGKKEAEAANDTGVSKPFDAANDAKDFEKDFGVSKEEFMEKELGVKL